MLKRTIRERKEYLYRKNLEAKERLLYEKKRKIREALAEGKQIPTELRNEEADLRKEIDLEDDQTAIPRSHIDDEYANATEHDPKILLTTSRNPSQPLTQFAKEMKLVFPNSQRINRGGQVISEIIEAARKGDFTDVILVHEHRGKPDGLIVCHLPFGPTAYFGLSNVVTRHDIKDKKVLGKVSEAYPRLILHNFSTQWNLLGTGIRCGQLDTFFLADYLAHSMVAGSRLTNPATMLSRASKTLGQRTANILKHLFPVPKPDSKRIMSFINQSDCIVFRHHVYQQHGGPQSIDLMEVGPRFEMHLYKVKLGTHDQSEAKDEWVLRPYMNTTRKRRFLGE